MNSRTLFLNYLLEFIMMQSQNLKMKGVFQQVLLSLCCLFMACQTDQNYLEKHLSKGAFKGVWVTNVGSDALLSEEGIKRLMSNGQKYQIDQLSPEERKKIYAGVLTALGAGYRIHDTLLVEMVNYHRSKGIMGEVFFYDEKFNKQRF